MIFPKNKLKRISQKRVAYLKGQNLNISLNGDFCYVNVTLGQILLIILQLGLYLAFKIQHTFLSFAFFVSFLPRTYYLHMG
jgi:hypothetical protein